MSLEVNVISASNVPKETFGKSDPYVNIEFQGIKKKTEVIKDEDNPVWNQSLVFDLQGNALSPGDQLEVQVKDWEKIGRNRLLGAVTVPLKDVQTGSHAVELDLPLQDANKRTLAASIKLKIVYSPPIQKQTAATADAAPDEVGGGIVEDGEEDEDMEGDEGDAADGGDAAADGGGVPGAPGGGKKRKRKRKRYRGKLSNKPQDFQVRIRVTEARQLQGSNIHPVAQVSVYNQLKQTHVKKSTNSPYWNEVFFCNFHASPAELFDELVEFKVFNSRKLRSDALLGSFKFDIGMVYESPKHAMLNKWLLLTDPEDPMGGSKGYLKMSIVVLGPGDSAPDFKTSGKDEEEDIEANLLRPAGVKLRPGTFTLRLYRGEDIPRMDSDLMQGVKKLLRIGEEQKELVDPYVIFSFAGKEVSSKTLYNNANPEYNQELRLGLMFPSMCERVKLQVMDWDRVSEDDAIGAFFLPLSLISSPGESETSEEPSVGFLPTFGPCFINLYGSPREFSEMPDEYEHLNEGKRFEGEGCAYRGRLLIEMKTTVGELPEVPVEDLPNDDVLRVQKYMRRRKFKLHVAFLSATMINATDAPVEFEVSIGNYGNKLDESVTPCASTTQPTNPIFDGNSYYYLPWGDTKPCVVVDSHWEDISWRLEALNMLNRILIRLQSHVKRVELSIKSNSSLEERAELLIALLDQLIADCSQPLPQPEPGRHIPNELDVHLQEHRLAELDFVKGEALKLRENATDVTDALQEVEGLASCLKNIAVEPQNSMPDVVFWMISGEKRIAFYRIPANDVLFSADENTMGKDCGQISTLFLRWPSEKTTKTTKTDLPGVIRAKIWLGLEKDEMEWHKMQTAGELAVFAETYENQVDMPIVGWTNKGPALRRPAWSDNTGKLKLKKEKFVPPPGWRWEGDWKISPELSLQFDRDAGHTTFLEDVYEQQARYPGGAWGPSSQRPWADLKGDPLSSLEEFPLPEGWKWDDAWQADLKRAVDEEGWEYCVEATLGSYGPVEKTFHLCRRKRWVRQRTLVADMKKLAEKEKQQKEVLEGWEYAPLFGMKFHLKERKMDMVRRRRWHRKMVAETKGASCFFAIQDDDDKDKEKYSTALAVPRMYLTFKTVQKYQLRAYLYQARDLLAADDSGVSDPYAVVSFHTQSQTTEKLKKTLCPTWDQTLLFEEIEIHGDPLLIERQPPEIIIEFFDHDVVGNPDYLGRAISVPVVFLDPSQYKPTRLNWVPINRGNKSGGELLAAFELFAIPEESIVEQSIGEPTMTDRKDLPFYPPKKGDNFIVPSGIRPVMQRTAIEVLCWGVRNLKKYQLSSINSPAIEFECGEHLQTTKVMRSAKKNPNFAEPLLFFDVMLPKDELYMPPMNIKVRDHREFGRRPVVGRYSISSLKEYRCDPTESQSLLETMGNGPGTPTPSTSRVMGTLDLAQSRMAELSGKFRGLTGIGSPSTSTETDHLVKGS
ncbi:dysferlin-like isoform X2 [Lingula anatina]|uniref:Dysferlin-like isoform X2 n=1 Tax=Lingula anatina TaxID=7574 RepID=A0A1S3HQI2_LINAN|nr:dysferlin-like isoform X2 [Lingula anatina]|eukprot:XP_013388295.1 dysferlin-like isoform X2 [Lingula anatina]